MWLVWCKFNCSALYTHIKHNLKINFHYSFLWKKYHFVLHIKWPTLTLFTHPVPVNDVLSRYFSGRISSLKNFIKMQYLKHKHAFEQSYRSYLGSSRYDRGNCDLPILNNLLSHRYFTVHIKMSPISGCACNILISDLVNIRGVWISNWIYCRLVQLVTTFHKPL